MKTTVMHTAMAILLAVITAGLSARAAADPLKVYVSIQPQAYLVERVGGEFVSVGVLVGPGQNHHTYEPTPRQLAELSSARQYFTIGLPFEGRLLSKLKTSAPSLALIDTSKGIQRRPMEEPDPDEKAEGGTDPHVWLSPLNAKTMAANIAQALKQADPAHAEAFDRQAAALLADLDALHARIAKLLAPYRDRRFYVYHPAFGYFADAYGLKQVAVETGGKEPGARALAALIDRARTDGVHVIFVQRQFSTKSAQALATAIQGTVVPVDPLARDYLDNLVQIAQRLCDGFGQP